MILKALNSEREGMRGYKDRGTSMADLAQTRVTFAQKMTDRAATNVPRKGWATL